MKRVIIVALILAFTISTGGYAFSQGNRPGGKIKTNSRGWGTMGSGRTGSGMTGSGMTGSGMMGSGMGSGMTGSGMTGSGMMGNQGGMPMNQQMQRNRSR